jgi:energy-coupling factor transport system ATP-binding protein
MQKRKNRMNHHLPLVELENVSVAFDHPPAIHHVLRDINLAIAHGEWVGIVGKNGSGKSTLAKVIAAICPLSRGKIHVNNRAVQMVFQNPEAQIVAETVFEEVCFGLENQSFDPSLMKSRVREVLQLVGLHVPLDQSISSLSGGQKQLLNIASCLAVDAPLLIFDEATAMLDPLARNKIIEIAHQLHTNGQTIMWITQWMEELAEVDRVIALEDGEIVFNGERQAFFYTTIVGSDISPCEQLGFTLPYVVQVTKHLLALGRSLAFLPISAEQLVQVVKNR